jgi:hypothetical protein
MSSDDDEYDQKEENCNNKSENHTYFDESRI